MGAPELLGRIVGVLLAPLVFLVALAKGARAFHPDGGVFRAEVRAIAVDAPLVSVAERLAGPALARLSAAMVRGEVEKPDVLGLGLRFGAAGAQDLLLATFDGFGPRQLRAARATTDVHDFLHNDYRAVSPFRFDGAGRWVLHARGEAAGQGATRAERLAQAMASGRAVLRVEAHALDAADGPRPLVDVVLVGRASVPPASLRLSPFHDGLGLRPIGFLAGIRWAVYPVSQLARRLRGG
ncbi:MAG TPA: hypothetical protein VF334_03030 [Polyangia bacterium]